MPGTFRQPRLYAAALALVSPRRAAKNFTYAGVTATAWEPLPDRIAYTYHVVDMLHVDRPVLASAVHCFTLIRALDTQLSPLLSWPGSFVPVQPPYTTIFCTSLYCVLAAAATTAAFRGTITRGEFCASPMGPVPSTSAGAAPAFHVPQTADS